jgi:DNA (cytosine-5)-methyltransferase 1
MKMRVISLFSGLGGLDYGFIQEGFEIVLACDNDAGAVNTHSQNLRCPVLQLDLAPHDPRSLPDAEVLIGGPPCQSFSLVGRRLADDPRGLLVQKFLEVVRAQRPLAFLMENVPGIESSRLNGRPVVEALMADLEALGYSVLAHKVLATDFLVPQLRRRLFLLGTLGVRPEAPDPDHFAASRYGIDRQQHDLSARAAIGDLGQPVSRGARAPYGGVPSSYGKLLRQSDQRDVLHHEMPRMSATDRRLVDHIPPGGNYRDVPDHAATRRILRFKETGGRTTTYGRLHPERPAYTINTYFRRPNVGSNFHYSQPRLITAREAMRFQALPDAWELSYSSQDQRNALIGNAVPPLVARAMASSVAEALARVVRARSRSRAA